MRKYAINIVNMQEVMSTHTTENSLDSIGELLHRERVNGWSPRPIDFYKAGYEKAYEYLNLYDHSVVADIGCSNGQRAYNGLKAFNDQRVLDGKEPIWPHLIGFDPLYEYMSTLALSEGERKNFTFVQARGENIPMPDSSVDVTTLHRVLYRADDPIAMLRTAKRITMANGNIIATTNFRDHAPNRYHIERQGYISVAEAANLPTREYLPPANTAYFEDLPAMLEEVGELEIIDQSIVEDEVIRISENRIPWYLDAMIMSFKRTGLPIEYQSAWRKAIETSGAAYIRANMVPDQNGVPIFTDNVHRGMAVIVNKKSA